MEEERTPSIASCHLCPVDQHAPPPAGSPALLFSSNILPPPLGKDEKLQWGASFGGRSVWFSSPLRVALKRLPLPAGQPAVVAFTGWLSTPADQEGSDALPLRIWCSECKLGNRVVTFSNLFLDVQIALPLASFSPCSDINSICEAFPAHLYKMAHNSTPQHTDTPWSLSTLTLLYMIMIWLILWGLLFICLSQPPPHPYSPGM